MSRSLPHLIATFACVACLLPAAANAGHNKDLYNYAVFPAGHWIGHGTTTVTHAGSTAHAESDGSFSFDLTVANGVATGTMAEEMSGEMHSGPLVAKFTGIAAGNGYKLGGMAGGVTITGELVYDGQVTGKGRSFPIHMNLPIAGKFAPDEYSCGTASGNLALKAMGPLAQTNTTISYPWIAVNVAPGGHVSHATAQGWFDTMSDIETDVDNMKAGEKSISPAQAQALVTQGRAMVAAFVSAEKCGGGSHMSARNEAELAEFIDDMSALSDYAKSGTWK